VKEIIIDDKTKALLQDIDRSILMLNDKKQTVCLTILNMNNIDIENEKWQLAQDNSKLFKEEAPQE